MGPSPSRLWLTLATAFGSYTNRKEKSRPQLQLTATWPQPRLQETTGAKRHLAISNCGDRSKNLLGISSFRNHCHQSNSARSDFFGLRARTDGMQQKTRLFLILRIPVYGCSIVKGNVDCPTNHIECDGRQENGLRPGSCCLKHVSSIRV